MSKLAAILSFGGIPDHVVIGDNLDKLQDLVDEWITDWIGSEDQDDYEGYIVDVREITSE